MTIDVFARFNEIRTDTYDSAAATLVLAEVLQEALSSTRSSPGPLVLSVEFEEEAEEKAEGEKDDNPWRPDQFDDALDSAPGKWKEVVQRLWPYFSGNPMEHTRGEVLYIVGLVEDALEDEAHPMPTFREQAGAASVRFLDAPRDSSEEAYWLALWCLFAGYSTMVPGQLAKLLKRVESEESTD